MTTPSEELKQVLMRADYKAVRTFFKGKTEQERKTLAKAAIATFRKAQSQGDYMWFRCCLNALLITADDSQLAQLSYRFISKSDLDYELLTEFKPSLQLWVEKLAADFRTNTLMITDLAADGFCTIPTSDAYTTLLMGERLPAWTGIESLERNKHFLEVEVWRLFEVEGTSERSLAGHDKFSQEHETWRACLIKLCNNGKLSRDRLLDASLEALERDFIQFRSMWHSRFHEALNPTLDERMARIDRYANLLASSIPTTVTFALDALNLVHKSAPLPGDLILRSVEPAVRAKSKSSVKSALSLLESAANDRNHAREACRVALHGLHHDSPEIQLRVLKLLTKCSSQVDEQLRLDLAKYVESVAPSVRGKLRELANIEPTTETDDGSTQSAGETYKQREAVPLNPLETNPRIEPLETIDDVIASCSYCLEHSSDVAEMERAIDGIVRFCARLPNDFDARAAALKKRSLFIMDNYKRTYSMTFLQSLFAGFVQGWITGGTSLYYPTSIKSLSSSLLQRRLEKILLLVNDKIDLPLLSAPTHQGGFIEPRTLAKRWQKWNAAGQTPPEEDQILALMRLPLVHLSELLPEIASVSGEFWDACRYAIGLNKPDLQLNSKLLLAANAYRNPVELPILLDVGGDQIFDRHSDLGFMRYVGISCPALRNMFVASGIRSIGDAIDYIDQTTRYVRAYIEVMLDPSFAFDRPSYHVLAASLIVADQECAGVARDILIQLIDRNDMNVEMLGTEIGVFLYCGKSKAKRLAAAMSDVARIGPTHASAVRQLLERALHGGPIVPRELSAVLELLYELLHAEGATLEDSITREHLQSLSGSSKAGKLAQQLLSVD